jgi:serine protease Do
MRPTKARGVAVGFVGLRADLAPQVRPGPREGCRVGVARGPCMPFFRRSNRIMAGALVVVAAALSFRPIDSARAGNPTADAPADESLKSLESRFESVTKKAAPAVVAISAALFADDRPDDLRSSQLSPEKLHAFLSKTTRIVGTGCVVDPDGFILTNDHVIDEAGQLWVTTEDRTVYPAFVVGTDPRSDLAVLKIPAHNLTAVKFHTGAEICRGQWSVAVGNPYGLADDGQMCVSVGIVSAVRKSLPVLSDHENRLYFGLIQTTAQINPGNSGGPLFDLDGDMIGINTAVVLPTGGNNGIGYAIPTDARVRRIVAKLKRGDEVVYGYLGVSATTATPAQRKTAGTKSATAVFIDSVESSGPAHDAGIHPGDVITEIAGNSFDDADGFRFAIGSSPVDRPIDLSVFRNGRAITITVSLTRRATVGSSVTTQTQKVHWAGLTIGHSVTDPAGRLIVQSIDPASPFAGTGLRAGDTIDTIAGKPVPSIAAVQEVVNDTPIAQCEIGTGQPTLAAADSRQ